MPIKISRVIKELNVGVLTIQEFLRKKGIDIDVSNINARISDEVHQMFVPGRGPGALDVLIDSAGALIGAAAVLLLLRAVRRRRQKTEKP